MDPNDAEGNENVGTVISDSEVPTLANGSWWLFCSVGSCFSGECGGATGGVVVGLQECCPL
ncbi:hypothetical protein HanRHA438_Chr03g0140611 [Helianthus annuus]|nr:hypothetical protein HanHA89_Chr03g0119291 [Helianthus annuus]KAJ0769435.1 hypothetical protein HanLR1_Chr03g0112701 [Helianthus annuus]KAJ0937296.1 hypothetical protein HanRHA438_Chr03g0140611 [Helianthus annuus]